METTDSESPTESAPEAAPETPPEGQSETQVEIKPAAPPRQPTRVVPIVLLAWAVAAVVLGFLRWETVSVEGPIEVDSVMRLVQVRDFMDGQSWYDTVQRRLGPPDGTSLHWSRLIDAQLAGLIMAFDKIAPSRWTAEMLAVSTWPLILLLCLMAATAWMALGLGDRVAGALAAILAVQSGPALVHYVPGAIDHHNAQILLSILFAGCIVRADRTPAVLAVAGIAAGLMLAIGTETLPVIITGTAILTLAWLFEPKAFAPAARWYGLAFAAATVASLAGTIPPGRWLVGACDTLSATYGSLAAAGGFGLAVFATLLTAKSTLVHRLVALAGLAGLCVAIVLIAYPDCLSGPLSAIDPRTKDIWYSRILETRTLADLFNTEFSTAVAILAVPAIGLLACLWFLTTADEEQRYRWAAAALICGTAVFAMMLQNRAAAAAGALSVPVVSVLAVRIARLGRGPETPISVPLFVVVLPFVCFVAWHIAAEQLLKPLAPRLGLARAEPHVAVARDCLERTAYRELAALEPTTVLTQTGLASAVLAYTKHSAVAGNYHRGVQGILDTYEAFSSPGDEPTPAIAKRNVGLIVVCHDGADGKVGDQALIDGLLGRLKRGEVPDWLEPVFAGNRLLAYKVKGE